MKICLSSVLDALFSGFICFLTCFVLLNYLLDRKFAIGFAIIFSILITMIAFKRLARKKALVKLKKHQEKQKNNCLSSLNLSTQSAVCDLFLKAVQTAGFDAERKNGALFIKEKNVAMFFKFSFDGVNKTDVVKAFNSIPKNYKAYIFSDTFTIEILSFIDRFDKKIIAVDGVKTYNFLKEQNCIPPTKLNFSTKKMRFSQAFSNLWQRKNAKRYFTFGALFLFMSYFVPIKIYYVLCGCLFLSLSLFCRLFSQPKTQN